MDVSGQRVHGIEPLVPFPGPEYLFKFIDSRLFVKMTGRKDIEARHDKVCGH